MEKKEMRVAYAETLIELAKTNNKIMVCEADLMRATGTSIFKEAYPERFVDVGVAESNMVGVAAGLSNENKIPFAATFGCFAGRRDFDQFFISANYAQLNVKLVGTDPGISAAYNGGTHMPFEDIAIMRAVPKLTIIEPSDATSVKAMVKIAAEKYGCVYMRLHRKAMPVIYKEDEVFEFGKAKVLCEGSDAVIFALGAILVNEALKAAELLKQDGIAVTVVDILTVKPLDTECVIKYAKQCKTVVTAENHQVIGGLGSAVAETLCEAGITVKFGRIGAQDEFGEVGTVDYLKKRFGMTAENMVTQIKARV